MRSTKVTTEMPRPKGLKIVPKATKRPHEEDQAKPVAAKTSKSVSKVDSDDLEDDTDLIQQFIEETEQQKDGDDDEEGVSDEFDRPESLTELKV